MIAVCTRAMTARSANFSGDRMSVTGKAGGLQACLAHDVTFRQALFAASGNEMCAALAPVFARLWPGGPTTTCCPPGRRWPPSGCMARWQVVPGGSPEAARPAIGDIVQEAIDAMEQAFPLRRARSWRLRCRRGQHHQLGALTFSRPRRCSSASTRRLASGG